jgi:hypothetical protein
LSKSLQNRQIFLQNREFFRFFAPFGRKTSKKNNGKLGWGPDVMIAGMVESHGVAG